MTRKRTNAARNKSNAVMATPEVMLNAMMRANAKHHTSGYFYGNMGDSIERRYNGGGADYGLGGGNDAFQGVFGNNSAWQAQGPGNYFGTGLLNGYGRMFSGVHGGFGGGFTYLRRFSSNAAFNHQIIASCMLAYFGEGVVRNIVDLYADFATEGVQIDHADESVRNFYQTWAKKIKLNERVHAMFINLFVSGNVFVHRRWASLDDKEKRAMKRACGAELINNTLIIRGKSHDTTLDGREGDFIDWYLANKGEIPVQEANRAKGEAPPAPAEEGMPENPEQRIPWGYTYLNPLQMELRGRRLRGDSYWIMAVDKKDALDIARGMGMRSGYSQDLGTTEFNLPKEFLSRIQAYQGPGAGYAAEVKLSDEELKVVQAPGKFDWFDWAIPFVFPALKNLSFKDGLRNMEIKAMQSVINSVFLFKLGRQKDGLIPEDEHFERLADMLQMPGQAMNIIWNEAIEAEVIQADTTGLFDAKKHESADKDILTALGVPEVLLGGKGGNFSNSYIGVATVLERLESYRNQVYDWLMGEMKIIADAMGFQKLPTVTFGRTSLKDEKGFQTFLTGLYDRGILSGDTLLREAETNAEVEAAKMKEEKDKYQEKDIFEPKGPFVKDPLPPAGAAPPGGGPPKPKTPNGRPPGSNTGPTGKQSNPRPPTGQNVAEILEAQEVLDRRGRAMMVKLEDFISDRLLQAKARENPNLKHVKSLRAQEKERLEWLIYNVFSHMPPPQEDEVILEEDYVINMLRSNACEKVKAEVLRLYTDKVAEYSKTYGKVPTREMRRQFMVSAWTQTAILEHLDK
jgi:hypothetical protein